MKQNVFITGIAGAIGSTVADTLIKKGCNVYGLDNLRTGKQANLNSKIKKFFYMDLGVVDTAFTELANNEVKIDIVIHCAAQKDVRASVEHPIWDAQENIIKSLNLFEAMKKHRIKQLLFLSSAGALFDINGSIAPISPYGVAKLAIEGYLDFYSNTSVFQSKVLRLVNVYGPRCDDSVVNIFCKKIRQQENIDIYGGEQVRDYIYVQDVADYMCDLISSKQYLLDTWEDTENIGSGISYSLIKLFGIVASKYAMSCNVSILPYKQGEVTENKIPIDVYVKSTCLSRGIDVLLK